MDAWELVKTWCGDAWQSTVDHPVYSFSGFVIFSALSLHWYCRLTVGKCKCDTSVVGKTIIITGGNSGIGQAVAKELAKRGGRIILACRSKKRGQKAVDEIIAATENDSVFAKELDLCSFASIRKFVDDFLETEERLDILVNNAGVYGTDHRRTTMDGCERVLQSNHLGHFLLTNLLLERMKLTAAGRIVVVTSAMYSGAKLNFEDFQNESYNVHKAYSRSKLANVLFTLELSRRLEGTGVSVNCVHPGVVRTMISREATGLRLLFTKLFFVLVGKTAEEGANAVFHLVLSPQLEDVSGKYFADCQQKGITKHALDEQLGLKLWTVSENVIKEAETKTERETEESRDFVSVAEPRAAEFVVRSDIKDLDASEHATLIGIEVKPEEWKAATDSKTTEETRTADSNIDKSTSIPDAERTVSSDSAAVSEEQLKIVAGTEAVIGDVGANVYESKADIVLESEEQKPAVPQITIETHDVV